MASLTRLLPVHLPLPSYYLKKKGKISDRLFLSCTTSLSLIFPGESIIQSYSKSSASHEDSQIQWGNSSHWLSEDGRQDRPRNAVKRTVGVSDQNTHLTQCVQYPLTARDATSCSLTTSHLQELLCQGKPLIETSQDTAAKQLPRVIARSCCFVRWFITVRLDKLFIIF